MVLCVVIYVPAPETQSVSGITIAVLAAASLVLIQYRRRHRTYPLLVLSVVIAVDLTDFVSSALPAVIGAHVTLDPNPFVGVAVSAGFVLAGVAFLRRSRALGAAGYLMSAASFLLAGAHLHATAIPLVAGDRVTPGELMRLAAYSLVLAAVARDHVRLGHPTEEAALTAQRERIACELHDGLAQHLAVIAFHGQRLEAELGANHPLTLSARRALATSRRAVLDLSASHAPSTSAALREVADELETRFGIDVTIHDEVQRADRVEADLPSHAREQFVRIAREAIVNAARHGEARHVDVTLATRGPGWLLTIADDGSGISRSQLVSPSGFGLRAMRARADELGAQFSAGPGPAGGTVLELSLAGSPDVAGRHRQPEWASSLPSSVRGGA
jgi:signal transduction histidine kinase